MTNSVGAPHGAEAAPQAGDVSGAVVPESDGVRGWMPIETAPKNQTEVIGMDARGRICRMWFFAPSSRTRNWLRFDDAKPFTPTRWMPLPPTPPSQEHAHPSSPLAEPLQGAEAPPPELQEDTAHHASAQSGVRGIGVGTVGSLPPVAPGGLSDD